MNKYIPCLKAANEDAQPNSTKSPETKNSDSDSTAINPLKVAAAETNLSSDPSPTVREMASAEKSEDVETSGGAIGGVSGSGAHVVSEAPTSGAGEKKESEKSNASATTGDSVSAKGAAAATSEDVRPKEKNPKNDKPDERPVPEEKKSSKMSRAFGSLKSSFKKSQKPLLSQTKSCDAEQTLSASPGPGPGETEKSEQITKAATFDALEEPRSAVDVVDAVDVAAATLSAATTASAPEIATLSITASDANPPSPVPSNPVPDAIVGADGGMAAGAAAQEEPKQMLLDGAPEIEAKAEPEAEAETDMETEIVDEGPREIMRLDVIFVCDTTGSMGTSVNSLALTIKQLLSIIKLLFPENRARVAVVSYKDHNLGPMCYESVPFDAEERDLIRFIDNLRPTGNWDTPEAHKTGLHEALRLVTESEKKNGDTSQTIVIHYTDTSPHHEQSRSHLDNKRDAMDHLKDKTPGYDWIAICKHFRGKKIPVFTFLTSKTDNLAKTCMSLLGELVILSDTSTFNITKATVGLLMHLLGESFSHNNDFDVTTAVDKEQLLTLPGERRSDGFPDASNVAFRSTPFQFERLESISHLFNTADLLRLFNRDEVFVDTVYKELHGLFTVENVMCLTYNPILGKLWRLFCRRRTDDRLQTLRDKLMRVTERLYPQSHQLQLKKWIDESYKTTDEIAEMIDSVHRVTPAIYRDLAAVILPRRSAPITEDTLRSLARAPSSASVSTWISLLTQLHLHEGRAAKLPRDKDGIPEFLPTMLENDDIFSNLPHLFSPGMKFSLKGAVLVAALCHLTESKHLADRARNYLEEKKGKYLNLKQVVDFPEIMAEEFVKIMYKIREYLLPEEELVYTTLYRVSRVRRASRMDYTGTFPICPSIANVWPDHKIRCKICGFLRSFTQTTEEDICGTCQSMRENPKEFGSYVPKEGDKSEDTSRLATCRGCKCIYQIVAVDDLKTPPKCHYCRVAKQQPLSIQCSVCFNKFMNPGDIKTRLGLKDTDAWTCFICQREPKRAFEEISFDLYQLAKQNNKLMINFGFREKVIEILYSRPPVKNLAMYRDAEKWSLLNRSIEGVKGCESIVFNERKCINSSEVLGKIVEDVTSGDLTALCSFCFSDKDVRGLNSPCGKCSNKACSDCLKEWFGNLKPGMLVLTTYLTCAFCKSIPARATIERYNPEAKALVRGEHLGKMIERMDPGIYYGWCKGCSKVCEIADKSCTSDVMPFTTNDEFLCENCTDDQKTLTNVPQCPGCGTPTVKAYGCNHIECPSCRTHWCYVCGSQFERSEIYDHLVEAHGSIGIEDAATAERNNAEVLGVEAIHVEEPSDNEMNVDDEENDDDDDQRRWDD